MSGNIFGLRWKMHPVIAPSIQEIKLSKSVSPTSLKVLVYAGDQMLCFPLLKWGSRKLFHSMSELSVCNCSDGDPARLRIFIGCLATASQEAFVGASLRLALHFLWFRLITSGDNLRDCCLPSS